MVEAHFITGETDSPIFRGFVVLTRFVFAYNALLLIIPSPSIDFHVFTYKKTDKDSRWSEHVNPEKPDVPINKNDAFQKVQKRRVQEKR